MGKSKAKHILALSGGKDSAALAVYMRENYPDIDLEYVFTDSGCELPETYRYLERMRAKLNIDITVIKPARDFNYWLKYFRGVLPSPSNRWCTRLLKLQPYTQWIEENYRNIAIYSYVGLRADENREGLNSNMLKITPIYPLIEHGLTLEDVHEILHSSGLGLPAYYKWRKRSGCYFCFFQSESEWRGLRKNHPNLFEKACQYEEQHSDGRIYTWREKGPLRDLESGESNRKVASSINSSRKSLLKERLKKTCKNQCKSRSLINGE